MLFVNFVLLLFIANTLAKEQILEIPEVDHLISTISTQQWDEDEALCKVKILNLLENVKNSTLWATYVWNSMPGSPSGTFYGARYHLGNYDQCLRAPWTSTHPELRTQYCLADVHMGTGFRKHWDFPGPYEMAEEYYIHTGTGFGRFFSYMAYGVCLPAGCPSKSAERIVRAILSTSHLRAARNATITIHHCEGAETPHVYGKGYYVYFYTFAMLALIAISSTYYVRKYPDAAAQDTILSHVAKLFYLPRNWETVFKEDKDEMTSMHGVRFLIAAIIVFGHIIFSNSRTSTANAMDYEKLGFMYFDLYVDTFFAMAGLLLGRSLFAMNVTTPINLMKNILKRYIRLFGPFAVTVFYIAYVLFHNDDGPMYLKQVTKMQASCENNWWLSLLMIANYVNGLGMCHPVAWSIQCDFHFFLVTVILLYIYQKNPRVGKWVAIVVLVLGFFAPGINSYVHNIYAIMFVDGSDEGNVRGGRTYYYGYAASHLRMGPYALGVIIGYYISKYNPAKYKNYWSKKTYFLGVLGCLGMIGVVLMLSHLCQKFRVDGLLAAIFVLFNRNIFSMGMLGIIIFCTYGDVPLIGAFLSWSVFRPLSRLSYGIYIIHAIIIYKIKYSLRAHLKHNVFDSTVEAFGVVVASLIFSMIVWLLVEAPLINFTYQYLNTKSVSKEELNKTSNGAILETDVDTKKVK